MGRGIEVAKLKCYSCPECGSFLEVDRVADTFDCPFCGNHFDVVDFHGADLFEQAEKALKRCDYAAARQKYEYLLSKKPEELEFLYGYACAVGEVQSLDKFEDPQRFSVKLQSLFNNDPRYQTGPAAPYFAKLAEMFEISRKHTELSAKANAKLKAAEDGLRGAEYKSGIGCGATLYAVVHFFVGIMVLAGKGEQSGALDFFLCLLVPVIVLIAGFAYGSIKESKMEPEVEAKKKPYYEMKTVANEMKKEVEALEESYQRAYKELPRLKAESGVQSVKEAKAEIAKPAGRQYTNIPFRSPYSRRDPAVVDAELKKTHVCKKCGADLRLDKGQKLFICDHCGVSYDYERFYGDPLTKAKSCLKDGDFKSADKWFAMILEDDQADFDANRGRILCAAKMYGFIQLKLNDKLANVDWDLLDQRMNEAIVNTMDFKGDYFAEVKDLFDVAHEYYEICVEMEGDGENSELPDLLKKKEELESTFNLKYRKFTENERRIRTIDVDKVSSDEPEKMLAYRMRIINTGRWRSLKAISPDASFDLGRLGIVKKVITEAKAESATAEFEQYFNTWEVFVDVLEKYSRFKRELMKMKLRADAIGPNAINNTLSEEWNELADKIREYEANESKLRNGYNQTYNLLISYDNQLFFGKSDSKA